jgi:hypothetical protein
MLALWESDLGMVCPSPGSRESTHPCGNIQNEGKIMSNRKNKILQKEKQKGIT